MSSLVHLAEKFINQSNKNVFLTGKAGTGKTTFLKSIVESTHKKMVVVAPTGIAAINAEGVTIHSFFQLPFGAHLPVEDMPWADGARITSRKYIRKGLKFSAVKQRMMRELELLVIDEASMVRADLLDLIDFVLRFVRRKRNVPFGGVQVLFVGDLLQLPPIVKTEEWNYLKDHYKSAFFFDAQVLRENPPVYIELDKVYRQQDDSFVQVLNKFRENKVTQEDLKFLNSYYRPDFKSSVDDEYIELTTHNRKADAINKKKLEAIPDKTYRYYATLEGEFKESMYPHPSQLEFKLGAQVMFVKNDPSGEQQFFNGKIGKIVSLSDHEIAVGFSDSSDIVYVEKYKWENMKYELDPVSNEFVENVIGSFTSYPIKLAWAITVHKSQGLTFDKAILDLEGAFAVGQVYVALSRLRSLEGMVLASPINLNSIGKDTQVNSYANGSKRSAEELETLANDSAKGYLRDYLMDVFDFSRLQEELKDHVLTYKEKKKKTIKMEHAGWAMDLYKSLEPIQPAALKFQGQINRVVGEASEDYLEFITERVKAAQGYFAPQVKTLSDKVFDHIDTLKSEKGTKAYVRELIAVETLIHDKEVQFQKALALCDSLIANTLLTREKVQLSKDLERQELIDAASKKSGKKAGGTRGSKSGGSKEPKVDTKKVSFEMYQQGKSIKEIADERAFNVQTIEGHLAHHIGLGDLDALDFISMEKLQAVKKAYEEIKTKKLSELKQHLGKNFSYSDIKFGLANLM